MAIEKKTTPASTKNPWLELLEDLWKNKLIVCLFVVVFGIFGVVAALWARPVYEANALIQVKTKGASLSAMLGDVGSFLGMGGSSSETEIQLMRSRRILEELIDSLGLQNKASPVGMMDRFLRKEGRVDIRYMKLPDSSAVDPQYRGKPWVLIADDASNFSFYDAGMSKVLSCSKGELCSAPYHGDSVAIRVSHMDVKAGQKFNVNQMLMVRAVLAVSNDLTISEAAKKTGLLLVTFQHRYMDKAVTVVDSLTSIYLRLNEEFSSSDMKNTLELLEAQLPVARKTLDSLMMELNEYREKIGSADIAAETKITLESQVKLQQQIILLEQMREEKARLFDASHPQIVTMDKQIASLKREMAKTNSLTKKLPETQQKILTMTAEAQYAQTAYSDLLKRVEQLRLIVAGTAESAQIVDHAVADPMPVKPKRKMIVLAFIFVGFCAAFGFISLRKKLKGMMDPFLVSKATGLAVYSMIAKGEKESQEGLRTLLLSLELESYGKNRTLCFTGLLPHVGCSFVAAQMGKLFAESGKKVLLIDVDLQKGNLGSLFGIEPSEGLVEVLAGKKTISAVVKSTQTPGLDLLLCGRHLMCSEGVLGTEKFANFIKLVRESYDIVILDTPSLQKTMDVSVVSRVLDEIVVILEYGRHSMDSILDGLALLPKTPTLSKVIAFNKCVFPQEKKI